MILACFMCKMAFDDRLEHDNCCDNCMYNNAEVRQVPEFDGYDITARLSMMYEHTIEYSNLLLSNERDRLLAANPIGNPRTAVEQTLACETALNNFAQQTWLDDGLADLRFPVPWRQRLAKVAIQIKTVEQLQKKLHPSCQLRFSSLHTWANTIVGLIVTSVEIRPPPPQIEPPPPS